MTEARLKTGLWVKATLRLCDQRALPAVLVRRGDPDAGAVLVKLSLRAAGCMIFAEARDAGGVPVWLAGTGPEPVPEAAADAYVARQVARDPDLWVIEIEDVEGVSPWGRQEGAVRHKIPWV
jgi:hypothetical protein